MRSRRTAGVALALAGKSVALLLRLLLNVRERTNCWLQLFNRRQACERS